MDYEVAWVVERDSCSCYFGSLGRDWDLTEVDSAGSGFCVNACHN